MLRVVARLFKSPVWRNRTLLAVSLTTFVAYAAAGMVGPVRVLYAQEHGASLAIIGSMASTFLVSNFLFQYPIGWLSDRWDRRNVIVVGLLIQAVLSLFYLLVTDPVAFVVLRFLEGMAAASTLPPARALINDAVPESQQGEAYGIFSAFFNGGFLLGPGIGGIVATVNYGGVFIGAAIFRLLAIAVAVFVIPRTVRGVTTGSLLPKVSASPRLLFTLPLLGAYLIAFGDYLYMGFDLSLMPLWMHDHLGATVAMIGIAYMLFAIPNMVLSPVGGRLADRRRRSTLILLFGLAQVPLYLAYGLLNILLPVLILFTVHGTVYALIQPAVDANVAAAAASNIRGRVQGLYSTSGLVGAFIGSIGFAPLYQVNFHYPLLAMGIGYGICVLIGGFMIRRSEKCVLPIQKEPVAQIPESA